MTRWSSYVFVFVMERVGRMDLMERMEDLERSPAREGCEEKPSESVGERELGRQMSKLPLGVRTCGDHLGRF